MVDPAIPRIAILGIPVDFNSSFLRGTAKAPPLIRQALQSDSSNLFSEDGTDLGDPGLFFDAGDLSLPESEAFMPVVENAVIDLLNRDLRPIALGGDHSITFPVIKAMGLHHSDLTVVQFDAHPDLYDSFEGSRYSHACPFARIMEGNHAAALVQLGIRSLTPHQREQAERFGVKMIEMRNWNASRISEIKPPIYVSFDLDALDPAHVPGISHPEPGGFSVRQALDIIQTLPGPIVGADVVEYNPDRDHFDVTAMVAAKIIKELSARMLGSK